MGAAILQILRDGGTYFLPVNNFVYDFTLLCGSLPQIDTGGFNALMPHEICQECNIITPFQEALSKPMPEGMWINHNRINFIASCQLFQLTGYTTGGNPLAILIQKNEAAVLLLFSHPRKGFILKSFGDVYPSELPTF